MMSVPHLRAPDGRDRDHPDEPAGHGSRYGDDLPAGGAMGPGGEFIFGSRTQDGRR